MEIINGNYKKTIGQYRRIWQAGVDGSEYIEYKYILDGQEYTRSVVSNNYYKICKKKDCKDLRFWVIYLPEKPNKSLIYLAQEIQGIENPTFPKKLDSFE